MLHALDRAPTEEELSDVYAAIEALRAADAKTDNTTFVGPWLQFETLADYVQGMEDEQAELKKMEEALSAFPKPDWRDPAFSMKDARRQKRMCKGIQVLED